ncbi:MAG: hypothetical protein R3F10_04210 [Lysobacteraceae bacterium]
MPSPAACAIDLSPEEIDLLDWFGTLMPDERLAQLQSSADFLLVFRPDDGAQLPAPDPDLESARR